ncbi:hypothetical protein VNO77_15242 [Canavalia gladiata]|uniref:Uncharacterized protein n=1 Tax=Canavalia gladiata TaxID=3824 RepID=A0AAN9M026_CANGL
MMYRKKKYGVGQERRCSYGLVENECALCSPPKGSSHYRRKEKKLLLLQESSASKAGVSLSRFSSVIRFGNSILSIEFTNWLYVISVLRILHGKASHKGVYMCSGTWQDGIHPTSVVVISKQHVQHLKSEHAYRHWRCDIHFGAIGQLDLDCENRSSKLHGKGLSLSDAHATNQFLKCPFSGSRLQGQQGAMPLIPGHHVWTMLPSISFKPKPTLDWALVPSNLIPHGQCINQACHIEPLQNVSTPPPMGHYEFSMQCNQAMVIDSKRAHPQRLFPWT